MTEGSVTGTSTVHAEISRHGPATRPDATASRRSSSYVTSQQPQDAADSLREAHGTVSGGALRATGMPTPASGP